MIFEGTSIDKDIIKEYNNELPEVWPEDEVHRRLEGRRRIAQPEWHYFKFVMAMVCPKCYLRNIICLYSNLAIAL